MQNTILVRLYRKNTCQTTWKIARQYRVVKDSRFALAGLSCFQPDKVNMFHVHRD